MQGSLDRKLWTPAWAAVVVSCLCTAPACGPSLPSRYVVERSIGDLAFRRYQRVLDVDFPIDGREVVGHTASYVVRNRDRRHADSNVDYATVFVSVYSEAAGLAAEVREHLDDLGSYEVSPRDLYGQWVLYLDGAAASDDWAIWISGPHVVKIGGSQAASLSEDLVEQYQALYPSDLNEHGRAREGTLSFGATTREQAERGALDLPRHLREGAPR